VLPSSSRGADDGKGGKESVASAGGRPVYFAINGNPFAGIYADKRFQRSNDDIRELLKPWREALSRTKVFPGLTAKGERVQVVVSGLRKPEVEVGWIAFETDSNACSGPRRSSRCASSGSCRQTWTPSTASSSCTRRSRAVSSSGSFAGKRPR
jgi:hypothetical protein